MTDTTTISITEEQRDRLSDRKQHDRESYKAVIARLLDEDTTSASDPVGVDADELAREVSASIDYAELANQVATELEGRMR